MKLSDEQRETIRRILGYQGDDFRELARLAGLDPAKHFRDADLRDIDFGRDDLSGFDFSGADLTGANLSDAIGIEPGMLDGATVNGEKSPVHAGTPINQRLKEANMYVFVMMPFKDEFREIRAAIREAVVHAKVECILADEIAEPGLITDQMTSAIRKSTACIADISGQNANVAWEIGYAQALGKPVITISDNPKDLYFDLKDQRTIFYNRNALSRTLVQALTLWLERLSKREVPPEDLVGTEHHERTSLALLARRVADTPYAFFDLFARARNHIFFAAQNHFFLAETEARREQLRVAISEFLLKDKTRRIEIMLCDPEDIFAVKTWQYVTAPRYEADLREASTFFGSLNDWAPTAGLAPGQLTIRRVPFVPFSITFVDPEDSRSGFFVLTPNAYDALSRVRPCFIVSKARNPDIVDALWASYYQKFNDPEVRRG